MTSEVSKDQMSTYTFKTFLIFKQTSLSFQSPEILTMTINKLSVRDYWTKQ